MAEQTDSEFQLLFNIATNDEGDYHANIKGILDQVKEMLPA